jgi:hypothetical protein
MTSLFQARSLAQHNAAQQSVHLTLGILRKSQAFFYASAFFQLDGFAVPAQAQVTQTGTLSACEIPAYAESTTQVSQGSTAPPDASSPRY